MAAAASSSVPSVVVYVTVPNEEAEMRADNIEVQREVYDKLCGTTQEKITEEPFKENVNPSTDENDNGVLMEVYVEWEATKDNHKNFINKLKVVKDATLSNLRKMIQFHLGVHKREFTFLSFADATCAPLLRDMESTLLASKLPTCNTQLGDRVACVRSAKGRQHQSFLPFAPLKSNLPAILLSCLKKVRCESLSPCLDSNLGSTPYNTVSRC